MYKLPSLFRIALPKCILPLKQQKHAKQKERNTNEMKLFKIYYHPLKYEVYNMQTNKSKQSIP